MARLERFCDRPQWLLQLLLVLLLLLLYEVQLHGEMRPIVC